MSDYFCISVTFLDQRFHGRRDGGEPEWPPSPLRLFQAMVAANADQVGADGDLDQALQWLEQQNPPLILAPTSAKASPYCLSVPNNAMDIVGRAWSRGNYFGSSDSSPAKHRTMKTVCPTRLCGGDTVYFAWKLNGFAPDASAPIAPLMHAARRLIALGWGVDLVVGDANVLSKDGLQTCPGERWLPTQSASVVELRTPSAGTLLALQARYDAFLRRTSGGTFSPVPPLTTFNCIGYRRANDPLPRPFAVFELRHDDGSFCAYSQRRLIHLAGMVRHLAIQTMQKHSPPGCDEKWVDRYVAGHHRSTSEPHRQFSYLPLPTLGSQHADQLVRRVMVTAPVGDDQVLNHLAMRLAGHQLQPLNGNEFGENGPPSLVPVKHDRVIECYTNLSNTWNSVTPVILPGHDDRKPAKTRRLIEAALEQSGVDQPCDFQWSAYSRFRKSLSAHKYGKDKKPAGYFRPDHLATQTAVHLSIHFKDDLQLPGPLAIGAGRHCGLGLMAHDGNR